MLKMPMTRLHRHQHNPVALVSQKIPQEQPTGMHSQCYLVVVCGVENAEGNVLG